MDDLYNGRLLYLFIWYMQIISKLIFRCVKITYRIFIMRITNANNF